MMLKDIEKLRDRFNDAAIEQSIVWINRIDKKQWVDAPAHWGEAGRLERSAAAALGERCAGGEGKGESKDVGAPAPGVAQRSQVSVAGRIHYKCLDSKLEFALGDMCIIKPEMGARMVSDEGNLLRFFVGRILRKHSTGSLIIHWALYSAAPPRPLPASPSFAPLSQLFTILLPSSSWCGIGLGTAHLTSTILATHRWR